MNKLQKWSIQFTLRLVCTRSNYHFVPKVKILIVQKHRTFHFLVYTFRFGCFNQTERQKWTVSQCDLMKHYLIMSSSFRIIRLSLVHMNALMQCSSRYSRTPLPRWVIATENWLRALFPSAPVGNFRYYRPASCGDLFTVCAIIFKCFGVDNVTWLVSTYATLAYIVAWAFFFVGRTYFISIIPTSPSHTLNLLHLNSSGYYYCNTFPVQQI